ncbi:MAG TPA: guanitoxin biosynthesis L-enduracididine beta-hydroxylase GntD [Thermoanaerobaculia bacterium]|nr:guanitoxin biosynthesis L-enduracididine beta-hydroxylase GntD [Thermoanaerobaculia bacterium]
MERSIAIDAGEAGELRGLAAALRERFGSAENPDFLRHAPLFAHELPRRLRLELLEFKLHESPAALILSGFPTDPREIGRTPAHWKLRPTSPALTEEILLVLFASVLGHTIGWSTQQDGRVVHDILPIAGHEGEQMGSGSKEPLLWHTEDAFHPLRGDYLGMACLRNPGAVPTTLCAMDDLEISGRHRRILFEPRFTIRPDQSHLPQHRGGAELTDELREAYQEIEQMDTAPEKVAVLFGHPDAPYLRVDPVFMDRSLADDPEAREALDALVAEVERKIRDVALAPGDFCFIDNFRAVHGRRPFEARFDGGDRWLKRVNVVRDLRKSRAARPAADSLILF